MTPAQADILRRLKPEQLLALTIKAEAGGEPVEGKIAVGCVIRNRTYKGPRYGGWEYADVILKPYQFSCFNENDPAFPVILELAKVPVVQWEKHTRVLYECLWIAKGIVKLAFQDNTKGADHYYNPKLCSPSWAKSMIETAVIGNHRFLKSKP